jgi:glutathione synthase/RimK-type ligase-like ATP-grasp enzyme
VDWSGFDLALIRSTWDYHLCPAAFAAWVTRLESSGTVLWNPPSVVRANSDKTYLKALEVAGVGVVSTAWLEQGANADFDEILAQSGAMVQPYLPEIASEGEWSFVFLGGEFSHAVLRTPRVGDFRVQEEHGGRTHRREAPPELLAQAREAAIAGPRPWLYVRVDGVRRGGELVVMELELIEPSLYLAYAPGAARRLAEAVKARLSAPRPSPTR